ncbi:MAG: ribosomal-processing cysteine protease Prp [Firmicutes bacterium]|jgi:uncharacterized protein YsxB (DUF464 family)|nr:ribosomal-processing cysteine protease Prp [Bacillota bacterium]
MIQVELYEDAQGLMVGFRVHGHAGFAPHGEDIVCAAVSALTQTAVLGLAEHAGAQPRVDVQEGELSCELPSYEDQGVQLLLKTMVSGLEQIAARYPDYVTLKRISEKGGFGHDVSV